MKIIKTIISIFGLWFVVVITSDGKIPFVVPVIHQFIKDWDAIVVHTFYSAARVILAIVISITLGTSIAIAMVRARGVDQLLNPFVNAWYPIPKAALTPIFIIVFGLGEVAKVSLLVFVTIFPIIIAVRKSLLNFPKQYTRIINCYNITGNQLIFKVYMRGCAKELLVTAKLIVGIAVAVLYLAESSFGSANGLGYYISRNMGVNQPGVLVGIIMLSLIGIILFAIIDWLEHRYIKW